MSNLAVKRILSDLKIVKTNNLDKHNIFVSQMMKMFLI